jgi:hypothetical protein
MTPIAKRRVPLTLWLGLALMFVCEALLFTDVHLSGRGVVQTVAQRLAVPPAEGTLARAARWMAVNMTAVVWVGYVLFLEGLLTWLQQGKSPVRRRPNHFLLLCLASIFIWCVFDAINFSLGMGAWKYIGMPGSHGIAGDFTDRAVGYFFAFGTIVPGMLMSGQVLLELGAFNWARARKREGEAPAEPSRAVGMPHWCLHLSWIAGLAMLAWVLLARTQITNYVLWTSLVFLLDPINYWLGRPSMFRDWEQGWFGRTLAAFAGGLFCGLLWEFWNYWALTKWTYHLPFLGSIEKYKYFEMPLPGLLGFIPFGIECWIMWQTMRVPLDGLVEPLPDDRSLL